MFRLIIADDEPDARDDMIACIDWAANGIEIVGTADNGTNALSLIEKEAPDLVLIDILMPEMTGLEVIKAVRQSSSADPEFIVVSGCDEFSYAQQAINMDVVSYLLKPFMPDELLSALRKAMRKTRVIKAVKKSKLPAVLVDFIEHDESDTCPYYPADLEHKLISALFSDSIASIKSIADDFIEAIFLKNGSSSQAFECFLILYAEICRSLIELGLHFTDNSFAVVSNRVSVEVKEVLRQSLYAICDEAFSLVNNVQSSGFLVRKAIYYIQKNYNKKIALDSLAGEIHVSPVYLSSLFSKVTGKTIGEYIQNIRVEHAKSLMQDSALSMQDIAERVGYSDSKYFAYIFKKVTGRTPATFRNQMKIKTD